MNGSVGTILNVIVIATVKESAKTIGACGIRAGIRVRMKARAGVNVSVSERQHGEHNEDAS